jgi:hypothetical protein
VRDTHITKFGLITLILASFSTEALAEEWKGIVPILATRSDVVRLFQNCEDGTLPCEFNLDGEQIRIVFSGMVQDYFYECSKNLPPDTVLLVEVTPKIPIPLKSLAQRYSLKRLGNTSEFSGYVDEHAGLILKTKSDNVIQLNYVADASKRIRCQSYYDDPLKFIAVVTHCPPVSLEGPSEAVTAGEILNFRASVQPDPKMTLVWTISGGKIVNRSGRQMSLDTSGLAGQTLNVTIQARGACSVENSLIVQIGPPAPHRRNLLRLLLALW